MTLARVLVPLRLSRLFRDSVDALRTMGIVLVLVTWPLLLSITWTLVCAETTVFDEDGVLVSSSVFPTELMRSSSSLVGYLSFFVTLTVSSVLAANLDKYNSGLERFNCFNGQCYDLALLLSNLLRTSTPVDVALDGTLPMVEVIEAIGLLPNVVKFVLRDNFDLDRFVNPSAVSTPTSSNVLSTFHEHYAEAKRRHPEDETLPFQVLFELIVHSFERFKDDGQVSEHEWGAITQRLETVYGPWGDLCTKNAYANPRFIQAFLRNMLTLYYVFLAPFFVSTFKSTSTSVFAIAVVVYLFSGCYEAARQIANPFVSAKDTPFFFDRSETVTGASNATRNNIQRLLLVAGGRRRLTRPLRALHSR